MTTVGRHKHSSDERSHVSTHMGRPPIGTHRLVTWLKSGIVLIWLHFSEC